MVGSYLAAPIACARAPPAGFPLWRAAAGGTPLRMRGWFLLLAACAGSGMPASPDADTPPDARAPDAAAPSPLQVDFLGVQGFLLRHGDDAILTAPLYTRPSLTDVTLGADVTPDDAATDAALAAYPISTVSAVITGHAHYDH